MNRRAFLTGLTGGLLTAPLAAEAQQAGKVWRIGFLMPGPSPTNLVGKRPVPPRAPRPWLCRWSRLRHGVPLG